MAELIPGDLLLTSSAHGELMLTAVVSNQHSSSHVASTLLTLHLGGGTSISLTPSHALFVNGELVAARDAKEGDRLTNAQGEAVEVITAISEGSGAVINPVTGSATLLVSGLRGGAPILAASHPIHVASAVVHAPITRAVVNAVLFAAGDVDTVAAGFVTVLAKLVATIVMIGTVARASRRMCNLMPSNSS